jgi:hypothetical protein
LARCAWSGFAASLAFALLAAASHWPVWIADLAVALGYAFALPMLLNTITGGFVGRVFVRQRHHVWWLVTYGLVLTAVCSHRLERDTSLLNRGIPDLGGS